ncbi:non-specific lipid-transfer protein 2-like [Canna indica]|uniref:Non-specific lipid-transfer protein 2-like n=1 Tax=Canna indica TaxID=4628 RepID=A0AAQ3JPN5_9LILI|nr:non-specific lipid-transfer protein 2-like [Canna indica]
MKAIILLFFVSTLLLCRVPRAASATCNPLDLISCSDAIMNRTPPTELCCNKLKQQEPCFCQYKKNPTLKRYVNSENGKKALTACGVPIPTC